MGVIIVVEESLTIESIQANCTSTSQLEYDIFLCRDWARQLSQVIHDFQVHYHKRGRRSLRRADLLQPVEDCSIIPSSYTGCS